MTDEEKTTLEGDSVGESMIINLTKMVYLQVEAATKDHDHVFYVADAFDSMTDRMYIDVVHLTPEGNQEVARRMVELLVRLKQVPRSAEGNTINH